MRKPWAANVRARSRWTSAIGRGLVTRGRASSGTRCQSSVASRTSPGRGHWSAPVSSASAGGVVGSGASVRTGKSGWDRRSRATGGRTPAGRPGPSRRWQSPGPRRRPSPGRSRRPRRRTAQPPRCEPSDPEGCLERVHQRIVIAGSGPLEHGRGACPSPASRRCVGDQAARRSRPPAASTPSRSGPRPIRRAAAGRRCAPARPATQPLRPRAASRSGAGRAREPAPSSTRLRRRRPRPDTTASPRGRATCDVRGCRAARGLEAGLGVVAWSWSVIGNREARCSRQSAR